MKNNVNEYIKDNAHKTIVLTVLSSGYFPVFEVWWNNFKKVSDTELLVLFCDDEVEKKLENLGISCIGLGIDMDVEFISSKKYSLDEVNALSKIWLARTNIIYKLVAAGINVLHTDCDAIWVNDPFKYAIDPVNDLSISIAYAHPEEVADKWGFVLCCGFFYISANKNTVDFIKLWLEKLSLQQCPDDQEAINFLLFEKPVVWLDEGIIENEAILAESGLSIKVISEELISRVYLHDKTVVYHPFLEGNVSEKVDFLSKKLAYLDSSEIKLLYEINTYGRRSPKARVLKNENIVNNALSKNQHKEKVLYVHIPKTAGSSFTKAFGFEGYGHIKVEYVHNLEEYNVFTIVRNPFSRLMSAFFYLSDRQRLPLWDHRESAFVVQYHNDFRKFVMEFLNPDRIYRSIHLYPQTYFLKKNNEVVVKDIFKYEELDRDLIKIKKIMGVNNEWEIDTCKINDVSWVKCFDDEMIDVVLIAYKDDFNLLRYSDEL